MALSKREKYSVGAGAILICAAALFQFGILPVAEKSHRLERQLASKQEALAQIRRLKKEYDAVLDKSANLKAVYSQRQKGFTLFAFLEKLAVKAGVDKKIDYMKPSSAKISDIELSQVEIKLKKIRMSELMSYLYLVETSENLVFIKGLAISREGRDKEGITATLHVETMKS